MSRMSTLHELAVKYAVKQPGMADSLTEEAPILRVAKFKDATHKLWNVAERMVDIEGPAFVDADAPLPVMSTSTELVTTYLHTMGGIMEVPTQKALKFGGMEAYFADRQDAILRHAGMTTEQSLVHNNWLKAAKDCGNLIDAGAPGYGWFMLFVRFDELKNTGLYDPDQFKNGQLLTISFPYGGKEHRLFSKDYDGVMGFEIIYRGNFGWQILDAKKTCAAIVNIPNPSEKKGSVTPTMIDEALAMVRAQPGSTHIFCSPHSKMYGIDPHKVQNVQLANSDTDARTRIETWNGISIIPSYNIDERIEHIDVPV